VIEGCVVVQSFSGDASLRIGDVIVGVNHVDAAVGRNATALVRELQRKTDGERSETQQTLIMKLSKEHVENQCVRVALLRPCPQD
jgi:hypothetical protein